MTRAKPPPGPIDPRLTTADLRAFFGDDLVADALFSDRADLRELAEAYTGARARELADLGEGPAARALEDTFREFLDTYREADSEGQRRACERALKAMRATDQERRGRSPPDRTWVTPKREM